MRNKIYISVLTTVRNGATFIEETLLSVYNQSYSLYEHVIIDDGSKDETVKIIEDFQLRYPDNQIRVITSQGIGRGKALNVGVRESSFDWLAIIDADDLWHPEKLKRQVENLSDQIDVLGVKTMLFHNATSIDYTAPQKGVLIKIKKNKLLLSNQLSHSSVIIRKAVCEYNEGRKSQLDYELWLRLSNSYSLYYLDEQLCFHRVHDQQSFEGKMGKVYRWRSFKLKFLFSFKSANLGAMVYNIIKLIFDIFFPRKIRLKVREFVFNKK